MYIVSQVISRRNNFLVLLFRDSLIVISVNAGASIFAGFVTFALIGSIAHETNMPVKDLVGSGKNDISFKPITRTALHMNFISQNP